MQFSEGRVGRVFVVRLEDGEKVPDAIESFALQKGLERALVILLGGVQDGSRIVVGPDAAHLEAIVPLTYALTGIQEIAGVGSLFPGEAGKPVLHLHAAVGREGGASVGCARAGLTVWLVGEVILLEIVGSAARREKDPKSGMELLAAH